MINLKSTDSIQSLKLAVKTTALVSLVAFAASCKSTTDLHHPNRSKTANLGHDAIAQTSGAIAFAFGGVTSGVKSLVVGGPGFIEGGKNLQNKVMNDMSEVRERSNIRWENKQAEKEAEADIARRKFKDLSKATFVPVYDASGEVIGVIAKPQNEEPAKNQKETNQDNSKKGEASQKPVDVDAYFGPPPLKHQKPPVIKDSPIHSLPRPDGSDKFDYPKPPTLLTPPRVLSVK